jgi:hypothetical protein
LESFWLTMLNRTDSDAPADLALTLTELNLLDKLAADKSGKPPAIKAISHYLIKLARFGGYVARTTRGHQAIWPFGGDYPD